MKNLSKKDLISEGSYGKVYALKNGNALKIEKNKGKRNNRLIKEIQILRLCKGKGIPKVLKKMKYKGNTAFEMELLGADLKKLKKQWGGKFSFQTTIMFGIQALERLEQIHSHGVIHRDIKDGNWVIGKKDPTKIYMIDFGLSEMIDSKVSGSTNYWKTEKFAGNFLFTSKDSHIFQKQVSKKNDLESLAYLMIHFYKGKLPWDKDDYDTRSTMHEKVHKWKEYNTVNRLCRGFPEDFK